MKIKLKSKLLLIMLVLVFVLGCISISYSLKDTLTKNEVVKVDEKEAKVEFEKLGQSDAGYVKYYLPELKNDSRSREEQ